MKKNIIWGIVIVIALILVGAIVYEYKQIKDMKSYEMTPEMEASAKKMYINEKYGFTFRYPNDWSVALAANNTVTIFKDSTGSEVMRLNTPVRGAGGESFTLLSTSTYPISKTGYEFHESHYIDEESKNGYVIVRWNENSALSGEIFYSNPNDKINEIFHGILQTFQFTSPSNITAIADWKTYNDTKNNYSISYPATYHVMGDDLFNYNENDPKYGKGNRDGVKIQIQYDYDTRFDLSDNDGRNALIEALNKNIATATEDNETPITFGKGPLGIIMAYNKVLSGPGGSFDVFYAVKSSADNHSYFRVLVWGLTNDYDNVYKILASLQSSKQNEDNNLPVITSYQSHAGPIGTTIELVGQNLSGFEGDLNAIIENEKGETAFVPGIGPTPRSDATIRVKISDKFCRQDNSYSGNPCTSYLEITPGIYKIYTSPWGKMSNKVLFTVTSDDQAYAKDSWGISFNIPDEWDITSDANDTIALAQVSGQWKGDTISMTHILGNQIKDTDAKFGYVTYYWNASAGKWYQIGSNERDGVDSQASVALPAFYLPNNVPVFVGRGRWMTYIVPLSHTEFLKMNITGSGNKSPLDQLVKSIKVKG